MKFPEMAQLAEAALKGSGATTHAEFAATYQCGVRTLRAWLAGEKDASGIVKMVLRQAAKGWRPS